MLGFQQDAMRVFLRINAGIPWWLCEKVGVKGRAHVGNRPWVRFNALCVEGESG